MSKSLSLMIQNAVKSLFEKGEIDSVDKFFSSNYAAHLTTQTYSGGHTMIKSSINKVRKAFPKIHAEVEILVEKGDRVAWQVTLSGIQEGAYEGFPASHREIIWRNMVVSRFENGHIAEEWISTDLAEQLLFSRKKLNKSS